MAAAPIDLHRRLWHGEAAQNLARLRCSQVDNVGDVKCDGKGDILPYGSGSVNKPRGFSSWAPEPRNFRPLTPQLRQRLLQRGVVIGPAQRNINTLAPEGPINIFDCYAFSSDNLPQHWNLFPEARPHLLSTHYTIYPSVQTPTQGYVPRHLSYSWATVPAFINIAGAASHTLLQCTDAQLKSLIPDWKAAAEPKKDNFEPDEDALKARAILVEAMTQSCADSACALFEVIQRLLQHEGSFVEFLQNDAEAKSGFLQAAEEFQASEDCTADDASWIFEIRQALVQPKGTATGKVNEATNGLAALSLQDSDVESKRCQFSLSFEQRTRATEIAGGSPCIQLPVEWNGILAFGRGKPDGASDSHHFRDPSGSYVKSFKKLHNELSKSQRGGLDGCVLVDCFTTPDKVIKQRNCISSDDFEKGLDRVSHLVDTLKPSGLWLFSDLTIIVGLVGLGFLKKDQVNASTHLGSNRKGKKKYVFLSLREGSTTLMPYYHTINGIQVFACAHPSSWNSVGKVTAALLDPSKCRALPDPHDILLPVDR